MFYDLSLPLRAGIPASVQKTFNKGSLISQGHVGTHLDRLLESENAFALLQESRVLFDVSGLCLDRDVDAKECFLRVDPAWRFRHVPLPPTSPDTGYGSHGYLNASFDVSWDLVQHLLERKVHYIGVERARTRRQRRASRRR